MEYNPHLDNEIENLEIKLNDMQNKLDAIQAEKNEITLASKNNSYTGDPNRWQELHDEASKLNTEISKTEYRWSSLIDLQEEEDDKSMKPKRMHKSKRRKRKEIVRSQKSDVQLDIIMEDVGEEEEKGE